MHKIKMAAQTMSTNLHFDDLLNKLSALSYKKSNNAIENFRAALEDFNCRGFTSFNVSNEKASLVVNQCCSLAQQHDPALMVQVLSLFCKILAQEQVNIEGKTLSVAVTWTLDVILNATSTSVITQAQQVMQGLVCGKCGVLENLAWRVVECCQSLMKKYVLEDPQIFLNSLNCLEDLISGNNHSDSMSVYSTVIEKCCDIYLKFLYDSKIISNLLWKCKCLVAAMRGLDSIVRNHPEVVLPQLTTIIGVVRGYMLYSVSGFDECAVEIVLPSNLSVPEEPSVQRPTKKIIGKYDRKSKKKKPTPIRDVADEEEEEPFTPNRTYVGTAESDWMTKRDVTSDSDFSDNEGGSAAKLRSAQSKVRRCCFILLGSLVLKVDTRAVMRFLPTILPDSTDSRSLMTCLNNEPSSTCRSEILVVLSLILTKFKMFFSLADLRTTSSFTTVANTVGGMLNIIHCSLISALKKENYKIVTVQILKSLSDLIRCTPYFKMNDSTLIPLIASEVMKLLKKSDVNIRIAVLVIFGCITSITPKVEEVDKVVNGLNYDASKIWLLDQCLDLLTYEKNFNPAVAIESLQVLAVLVRSFPRETLVNHFEDVQIVMNFTSEKYDSIIRLYAAKFTVAAAESLQSCVVTEDESCRVSPGIVANIWSKVIFPGVTSLMEIEGSSLKAAGCDSLATLALSVGDSSQIFDELPRQQQIIGITHLFGCTKQSCAQVRRSAIRALAAFVRFKSLREDPLFLLDAIDALFVAAADDNVSVRIQAAWLFNHLSEAVQNNRSEGYDDEIADHLLFRMLQTGICLANDNKKAKPYALRGISNLISFLSEDDINKYKGDVCSGLDILVENASTGTFMKARWNACYALGGVLANPAICVMSKANILPVLFQIVHNYQNFKVRISASQALTSLPSRVAYGEFYTQTWRALLQGLENAENMTDYSEYQHRDQLIDQLCFGLCFLVSIALPADIMFIHDLLLQHFEAVRHHFGRFRNRIVPEKGNVILKAETNLSEMISSESLSLNRDQKNALSMLFSIFMSE